MTLGSDSPRAAAITRGMPIEDTVEIYKFWTDHLNSEGFVKEAEGCDSREQLSQLLSSEPIDKLRKKMMKSSGTGSKKDALGNPSGWKKAGLKGTSPLRQGTSAQSSTNSQVKDTSKQFFEEVLKRNSKGAQENSSSTPRLKADDIRSYYFSSPSLMEAARLHYCSTAEAIMFTEAEVKETMTSLQNYHSLPENKKQDLYNHLLENTCHYLCTFKKVPGSKEFWPLYRMVLDERVEKGLQKRSSSNPTVQL